MHTAQGLIDIKMRGVSAIFQRELTAELIDQVWMRTAINSFMICELQACVPRGGCAVWKKRVRRHVGSDRDVASEQWLCDGGG